MLPDMTRKPRIAIVGAGNLGSALAVSLRRAGFTVDAVIARPTGNSIKKARVLAKTGGGGFGGPAPEIAKAARSLAQRFRWNGTGALHSSGAWTSDELEPLRGRGA